MAEKRGQELVEENVDNVIKRAKLDNDIPESDESSVKAGNDNGTTGTESNCVTESCEAGSAEDDSGDKQSFQNGAEALDQSLQAESETVRESLERPSASAGAQPAFLDPLSYTRSDEFTSEIFKIQIHNLPKFGFNVSYVLLY